jgi:hypothetical protein
MAIIEDFTKSNALFGLAVGTGLVIAAPVLLPIVSGVARPIVKTLIKVALTAYETGREQAAELTEFAEDLFAEARAEIEQERATRPEQPSGATPQSVAASAPESRTAKIVGAR